MSLETHIRESVVKTALFHILKNQSKSPERICRNIQELFSCVYPEKKELPIENDRLLNAVKAMPIDQLVSWLLSCIQGKP